MIVLYREVEFFFFDKFPLRLLDTMNVIKQFSCLRILPFLFKYYMHTFVIHNLACFLLLEKFIKLREGPFSVHFKLPGHLFLHLTITNYRER